MDILLKYLIIAIKPFWDKIAAIQDGISIKYSEIFRKAIELSKRFNELKRKDKKIVIALCANNSIEWIISFLSVVISNNTLVLISPSMTIEKILHILVSSEVDIIITDSKNEKLHKILTDFVIKFRRIILYTENIKYENNKTLHVFDTFRVLIRNFEFGKHGDDIIIYTPNKLKEIKLPYDDMLYLLMELKNKEIFKSKSDYLSYAEFTYNYIFGMLLPLISNSKIIITNYVRLIFDDGSGSELTNISYNFYRQLQKREVSTVVVNANQFNQILKTVKEKPLTFKEFTRVILNLLPGVRYYKSLIMIRKLILKKRLQTLLPDLERMIILNSSLSLNTEKLLKKIKFPYTVTYGTVETYGIATYSHPSEHIIESVGRDICGELLIQNGVIFHKGKGDLRDYGFKDQNGNIYFMWRDSSYGLQTKRVEDVLKQIPFVSECILKKSLKLKEHPYLIITVDYEQAESMKIKTNKELIDIINTFVDKLPVNISQVIIWNSMFQKDTYDRIVNV
jgi:hypothetical protein